MQVGSAEFSRLGRVLILLTSTTLAYHISKSAFKKEVTHEHRVRTKTPIPSDIHQISQLPFLNQLKNNKSKKMKVK